MKRKSVQKKPVGLLIPIFILFALLVMGFLALLHILSLGSTDWIQGGVRESKLRGSISENLIIPAVTPNPTPTPTPIPYPPAGYHCVDVPILMYHHVAPLEEAKRLGHASLTVDSRVFASHMQYLADRSYSPITLASLSEYFDGRYTLPKKPIILTFDDGYDDFYHHALPVLESHRYVSDLFVPTGLIENPGYLTWDQIKSAQARGTAIGHHTWSHANIARNDAEFFEQELDLPTQQLLERGFGPVHVFAYPYGTNSKRAVQEIKNRGFSIAVTTVHGRVQCREDRLLLRRIRIGNGALSSYGL